jgi:hypothetical protein
MRTVHLLGTSALVEWERRSLAYFPVKCSSKAVSQKKFQEVKLQNYPKVIEIYRSPFFTSLVANL